MHGPNQYTEREKNVNGYSMFTPLFELPDSGGYFLFLSHLIFSEVSVSSLYHE